jgi:hypothetical protein
MLKRGPPDQTENNLGSLISSRNAVQFLYEESIGEGNADITLLLEEALTCGDVLIAEKQEISYRSKDALLYLYFLRAIIGLHPKKIRHLVALLKWLEIIPRETESGKSGAIRKRPEGK